MKISLVLEGQPSELIDALQKVSNEPIEVGVATPAAVPPTASAGPGGETTKAEKPKKTTRAAAKPEQDAQKPDVEEQVTETDKAGQRTPEVEDPKPEAKAVKKLALEDVRLTFGKKWQKDSKAVTALLAQTGHDKLTTFWGEVTDEASRVEFLNALEEI